MERAEVINNPLLKDLPFKIELNKWGKILMSPDSNNHGRWQFKVGNLLDEKKESGEVITGCSINTAEGEKVVHVVWVSDEFIERHGFAVRRERFRIFQLMKKSLRRSKFKP